MTPIAEQKTGKLLHVARIFKQGQWSYLFLRKNSSGGFTWHEEIGTASEAETALSAQTVEEAMRLAPRMWKTQFFQTLLCGFCYTLPERDEHGINALFHQMVASYSNPSGIYYDEELGNNCFVQNASQEAYELYQRLKVENRLV